MNKECIPVGCVPSAAVAVCCGWGVCPGGCLPRGVSAQGSVSAQGCVCLLRGWVSAHRVVCPVVCVCRGMSAQGVSAGGCLLRGMYLLKGVSARRCLPDTPLWTEWQMLVKTLPCGNYVADGNYHKCDLQVNRQIATVFANTGCDGSRKFA